jgi:integrase
LLYLLSYTAHAVSTLVSTFVSLVDMAKVQGLRKGKDAYFYVRRIPTDLAHHFDGRQQVSIPLGTSNGRVAAELAKEKAVELDKKFADLRLGLTVSTKVKAGRTSRRQLEQIARLRLHGLETEAERSAPTTTELGILLEDEGSLLEEIQFEGLSIPYVSELAKKYGLKMVPGTDEWCEFGDLLNRVKLEHKRRQIDRARTLFRADSHDPLFSNIWAAEPAPKTVQSDGIILDDLIERFENDPLRASLSDSSRQKFVIPFAAMRELLGNSFPVRQITREQCANVRDLIAKLPANHKKHAEFRGMSLTQIAQHTTDTKRSRLSRGSVAAYTQRISTLLAYAVECGLTDVNPATRLAKKTIGGDKPRVPFNKDELKSMVGRLTEWAGDQKARLWIPLIALFTGMRLGEIVWLDICDIQKIEGDLCIVVRPKTGRRLKNKNAMRTIPIHPTLIELGFERLLEGKSKEARLFEDLPGDTQRHAVDLFQKRFSYWTKNDLKFRQGVVFHSFRHSFRDAMANASFPRDVVQKIGGWSGRGVEDQYGQGARVSVLAKWMREINYPEIDLSHLDMAK